MKNYIKPWLRVCEDHDEDLGRLRELDLMPKAPLYSRVAKMRKDFESDDAIAKAIEDFENAANEYINRTFSMEEQRSPEFTKWRRYFTNDCEDLTKRTWFEWFWTH